MTEQKHEVTVSFVRRYSQIEHTCPECGTEFLGPRLRQYCGAVCKQKAAWKRHGAEWNANRKKSGAQGAEARS